MERKRETESEEGWGRERRDEERIVREREGWGERRDITETLGRKGGRERMQRERVTSKHL